MIRELERVALTTDLPEHSLKTGDIGTVVLVHQAKDFLSPNRGYEVEFVTLAGETITVVSLFPTQLRPLGQREIAQARVLA